MSIKYFFLAITIVPFPCCSIISASLKDTPLFPTYVPLAPEIIQKAIEKLAITVTSNKNFSVSPHIGWETIPGTKSYVLIGEKFFVYPPNMRFIVAPKEKEIIWAVFNIPSTITFFEENESIKEKGIELIPYQKWQESAYLVLGVKEQIKITLYALDSMLSTTITTKEQLLELLDLHTIATIESDKISLK